MRRLGVLLVIAAIGGFLTVADDLRHKGELLAVSSILVCGLVLVALSGRKGPGAGLLCLAALLILPCGGGAVLAADTAKGTGRILSAPPAKPDAGATYLFYLHGRSVGRHAELRLDTGLHHGFLYRAMPEWIGPVVRWARERDA